jgi:hypothetical protein
MLYDKAEIFDKECAHPRRGFSAPRWSTVSRSHFSLTGANVLCALRDMLAGICGHRPGLTGASEIAEPDPHFLQARADVMRTTSAARPSPTS